VPILARLESGPGDGPPRTDSRRGRLAPELDPRESAPLRTDPEVPILARLESGPGDGPPRTDSRRGPPGSGARSQRIGTTQDRPRSADSRAAGIGSRGRSSKNRFSEGTMSPRAAMSGADHRAWRRPAVDRRRGRCAAVLDARPPAQGEPRAGAGAGYAIRPPHRHSGLPVRARPSAPSDPSAPPGP
jgi:hypothetical protein